MRLRLWLRAVLMVLLGLFFFDTLISGRITYYINQSFHWLAAFAGVAFLTLGVAGIVELMREPSPSAVDVLERDPRAHVHGVAPSWAVLGVIAVPLVLGVLVPAKPLGAAAVGGSGLSNSLAIAAQQSSATTFSIPPLERNIMDWLRSFGSSETPDEITGQEADVIGFVYHDVRLDDQSQFFLMRFIVSCCVADANSVGLVIETAQAPTLKPDSWVRITGRFQAKEVAGQRMPVLVAESITAAEQPEHPYLYP
jgi:putative membrane protein